MRFDRSHLRLSSDVASIIVIVAAIVLVVFTFTRSRGGANVRSRLITVERLVEAGTMVHDGTPFRLSIDSVQIDGKRYSSKPPLYSFIMAAEAYVLRMVTDWPIFAYQNRYLWFLALINQVLLYLLVLVLGLRLVRKLTDQAWTQAFFVAALSFGALPYGYAVTINNHTPAAAYLFIAFYLIYGIRHEQKRQWYRYFGVGFLVALATSMELTAGIFMVLFVGVLAIDDWKRATWAVAGALVPLLPTFVTYYALSGSFMPFYMQDALYDYPGSYWQKPQMNDALDEPKWLYAAHVLIGHHGLFSLSPILLLGLVGLARGLRDRTFALRREYAAIAAGAVVIIVYVVLGTKNYGGTTLGMRWFAQFVPLLVLAALPMMQRLGTSRRRRVLGYGLLAVSAAVVVEALARSAFSSGGWVVGLGRLLDFAWM